METHLKVLLFGLLFPLCFIILFILIKPKLKHNKWYQRFSGRAISIGFSVASAGLLTLIVTSILESFTEFKIEGDTRTIFIIVTSNIMFVTFYYLYDNGLDKFNKEIIVEIENKFTEVGINYRDFFRTFFTRSELNIYRDQVFDSIVQNYNDRSYQDEYIITFEGYLEIAINYLLKDYKLLGFNYTLPPLWYSADNPEFSSAISRYKNIVSKYKESINRITIYPNKEYILNTVKKIIEEKKQLSSYDAYSWLLDLLKEFPHVLDQTQNEFNEILIDGINELSSVYNYSFQNHVSIENDPYDKIIHAGEQKIEDKLNWFINNKSDTLNTVINESFIEDTGDDNSFACLKINYESFFYGKKYREIIIISDGSNNPCIGLGIKNELKDALILKILNEQELRNIHNNASNFMCEENLLRRITNE